MGGQHTQGLEVLKGSRRGSKLALSCPHPTFELGVPIWESEWAALISGTFKSWPHNSCCGCLGSEGQQEVI